jgi:hypothetical protein
VRAIGREDKPGVEDSCVSCLPLQKAPSVENARSIHCIVAQGAAAVARARKVGVILLLNVSTCESMNALVGNIIGK